MRPAVRLEPRADGAVELVTLEIELGIDAVEGTASGSDNEGGPVNSGRKLTSRVQVLDGQPLVIAGMTGTKLEVGETKVPWV